MPGRARMLSAPPVARRHRQRAREVEPADAQNYLPLVATVLPCRPLTNTAPSNRHDGVSVRENQVGSVAKLLNDRIIFGCESPLLLSVFIGDARD